MEKIEQVLRKAREEKGFTQEQVAERLGMSRPTYIAVENGKRELTLTEYDIVRKMLDLPEENDLMPRRDDQKFRQMFFYFLRKYPDGIPKTKLAKLLYLADFSKFYFDMEPMSGVQYIRRDYGPVADVFFDTIDDLYDHGEIDIETTDQAFIVRNISMKSNDDLLETADKKWMDKIDEYWHGKKTAEIVEFTHSQKPWGTAFNNEKIPYFTIIQEDPTHVYAPGSV